MRREPELTTHDDEAHEDDIFWTEPEQPQAMSAMVDVAGALDILQVSRAQLYNLQRDDPRFPHCTPIFGKPTWSREAMIAYRAQRDANRSGRGAERPKGT